MSTPVIGCRPCQDLGLTAVFSVNIILSPIRSLCSCISQIIRREESGAPRLPPQSRAAGSSSKHTAYSHLRQKTARMSDLARVQHLGSNTAGQIWTRRRRRRRNHFIYWTAFLSRTRRTLMDWAFCLMFSSGSKWAEIR